MARSLEEQARAIELLLLDVDGVLTDGSIIYSDQGAELKAFHVHDGSGIRSWTRLGKQCGIITGRRSPVVERRAAELGIQTVIQGTDNKLAELAKLLEEKGLAEAAVCYVGDDLPDLPLLRRCGLGVAVADACPEARAAADVVTSKPGGRGAVREVVELLLRIQGRWAEALSYFDRSV